MSRAELVNTQFQIHELRAQTLRQLDSQPRPASSLSTLAPVIMGAEATTKPKENSRFSIKGALRSLLNIEPKTHTRETYAYPVNYAAIEDSSRRTQSIGETFMEGVVSAEEDFRDALTERRWIPHRPGALVTRALLVGGTVGSTILSIFAPHMAGDVSNAAAAALKAFATPTRGISAQARPVEFRAPEGTVVTLDSPASARTPQPESVATPSASVIEAAALEPIPPEAPIQASIETRSPAERIAEARAAQQEALARGESRIPVPEEILKNGGKIVESSILRNGERDFHVVMPPNKPITYPAFVDGEVIEAARINKTSNSVEIRVGNKVWILLSPLSSRLLVHKGDRISLGTPVLTVENDPNSETQINFEGAGTGKTSGTIVVIGSQDRIEDQWGAFESLSVSSNLLTSLSGELVTIPTLGVSE